jgi:hypothetical protein
MKFQQPFKRQVTTCPAGIPVFVNQLLRQLADSWAYEHRPRYQSPDRAIISARRSRMGLLPLRLMENEELLISAPFVFPRRRVPVLRSVPGIQGCRYGISPLCGCHGMQNRFGIPVDSWWSNPQLSCSRPLRPFYQVQLRRDGTVRGYYVIPPGRCGHRQSTLE